MDPDETSSCKNSFRQFLSDQTSPGSVITGAPGPATGGLESLTVKAVSPASLTAAGTLASLKVTRGMSEAETQTSPLKDLVQEVFTTMVTNYLKRNRIPLIACQHTRGLQLDNIIKAIADSHMAMCTKSNQSQPLQESHSYEHEVELASLLIQELSNTLTLSMQPEVKSSAPESASNVNQARKRYSERESSPAPKPKKLKMQKMPKGTVYPCAKCGSTFNMQKDLISHYSSVHSLERPFKCDLCQSWFKTNDQRTKHTRMIHLNLYQFYCSVCQKGCASKKTLIVHENRHMKEEDKFFKCKYCKKGFSNERELLIHVRTHEVESKVECELCPAKFCDYNQGYKIHMKEVHGAFVRSETNKCLVCDKDFGNAKQRPLLMKHMEENHRDVGVPCSFCGRKFASAAKRDSHEMKEHEKYSPVVMEEMEKHKCIICGKKFITGKGLKNHKMNDHKTVSMENYTPEVVAVSVGKRKRMLLMCKLCGGLFTERTVLDQHFPIHLNNENALTDETIADILDTQEVAASSSESRKSSETKTKKKKKSKKKPSTVQCKLKSATLSKGVKLKSATLSKGVSTSKSDQLVSIKWEPQSAENAGKYTTKTVESGGKVKGIGKPVIPVRLGREPGASPSMTLTPQTAEGPSHSIALTPKTAGDPNPSMKSTPKTTGGPSQGLTLVTLTPKTAGGSRQIITSTAKTAGASTTLTPKTAAGPT